MKVFWALEIHVLVNMSICSGHFTYTHYIYISASLKTFSLLLICPFFLDLLVKLSIMKYFFQSFVIQRLKKSSHSFQVMYLKLGNRNKDKQKIYVKLKHEISLLWNTNFFFFRNLLACCILHPSKILKVLRIFLQNCSLNFRIKELA